MGFPEEIYLLEFSNGHIQPSDTEKAIGTVFQPQYDNEQAVTVTKCVRFIEYDQFKEQAELASTGIEVNSATQARITALESQLEEAREWYLLLHDTENNILVRKEPYTADVLSVAKRVQVRVIEYSAYQEFQNHNESLSKMHSQICEVAVDRAEKIKDLQERVRELEAENERLRAQVVRLKEDNIILSMTGTTWTEKAGG